MTEENHRLEHYGIGIAVALAFGAPKELTKYLVPPRGVQGAPQVTGMLKIPNRRKEEVNGK